MTAADAGDFRRAGSVNRRTNDSLGSIVASARSLDFCCLAQPESIASNTAAGSSRCTTPDAKTRWAEPGTLTRSPHQR